jgi:FMN phosphatase YigB (HAD superfamily)
MKALLLDLDDTLLTNGMSHFYPAYFDRLSSTLQDLFPPAEFLRHLQAGTRAMLANQDPARTLQQAFAGVFYPALGRTEAELLPRFEDFYRRVFPTLRSLTQIRPTARTLVEQGRAAGFVLAVATNPILPRMAMEERLRWADVPALDGTYALISCYEDFHFAKPDPAFYAELTGRLGVAPVDAGMVGNNVQDDLDPARAIGLATFHVAEAPDPSHGGGGLEQVLPWASRLSSPPVTRDAQPSSILARLRGHLAAARGLALCVRPEDGARRSSAEEWSPVEIVCHLRDVDREVNRPRLKRLLQREDPFLSAVDPDQWAKERHYRQEDIFLVLDEFTQIRKAILERLASLEAAEWRRTGRHALLGPTTLAELMAVICEHDVLHLAQLRRSLPSG